MEDKIQLSMASYQLCCCCKELVCMKGLWDEYEWMGNTEVYGNMLKECFNLSWPQRDEAKDQICEVCITQLRNAMHFKQKVLQSQSALTSLFVDMTTPVKEEHLETEDNKIESGIKLKTECVEEDCHQDEDILNDININDEYTKIVDDVVKRKTVKRKMTETKSNCRRKSMRKYQGEISKNKIKYINPRQNASLILEHSTILPFKSNKGYFNCFYCNKQFASFDQLKSHVGESHENINFKLILKSIRRPRDRIRADVSDINCRICKKKIDNLDFLIKHLTDDHNVQFNFDSDSIKPAECILAYDLSEGKYRCYECKAEFFFFKTLTHHMNEHSTSHVCDVCGRCFLLADRLRAHAHSHKETTTAECDLCGKVCGSKMLLRSHIRYKHKKLSYMCSICDKSFLTSSKRVQHLEEVHNRAPLNLNCKTCSKKFESHKSLYSHKRSDHLNIKKEPKYGCNICGTMFKSNDGLSQHMVVHSGEKNYECEVCHKKYGRRKTLIEHMRIHLNDRRFACGACSQAFVQKCSLKNHIRVHHGNMDYNQLIVDKKLDAK